jgi:hypothetical protein
MDKTEKQLTKQVERLFYALRAVDAAREPAGDYIKFLVSRLEAVEIRMDGDKNHGRAHIHVKYGRDGHAASYAIDDGSRLAGVLPSYYNKTVRAFIQKNRTSLEALWKTTQSGKRDEGLLLQFQTTVYD